MIKKRQVLTISCVALLAFLIGAIVNVNLVTMAGKNEKAGQLHPFYRDHVQSPVIPSPGVWHPETPDAPSPFFNTQGYKRFSILIKTKSVSSTEPPCPDGLTPYANLYFGIEFSPTEGWAPARVVDQIHINSWLPTVRIYQSDFKTYEIAADYFHIDIVNRVGCVPLEFDVYVYVTT